MGQTSRAPLTGGRARGRAATAGPRPPRAPPARPTPAAALHRSGTKWVNDQVSWARLMYANVFLSVDSSSLEGCDLRRQVSGGSVGGFVAGL